jgi:hypothetical protein
VLSPNDRSRQVLDKVGEYLEAGVRLVWVIDPERRTAAVHRSLTKVRELGRSRCRGVGRHARRCTHSAGGSRQPALTNFDSGRRPV